MAITNTHETDIISQIRLPNGKTYEIHDPNAIHDVSDLDLAQALVFKGTVEGYAALPTKGNKTGDVYISIAGDGNEYVWDGGGWVALGNVHDAASSTHTHTATVTGTNSQSDLVGSVNVTSVTVQNRYIDASAGTPTLSKTKVLGANTSFSITGGNAITTKLNATASDVAVDGDGTASAITGFDEHTTANVINSLTKETIASVSSADVTIPNVTGNTSVTASKVSVSAAPTTSAVNATVVNGVLTLDPVTVVSSARTVTATDVSASKVTLGTSITASKVTTSDKQVVTGGTYKNVIEELGNPYTTDVLTGVKVTAQPTITLRSGTSGDVSVATGVSTFNISPVADEVEVVTNVTPGKISLALHNNETQGSQRIVSDVETDITSVSFNKGSYAKPQTWKQDSGTTGTPNN